MKISVVFPLRNCEALFTVGSFIKGFSFFLIFVGREHRKIYCLTFRPEVQCCDGVTVVT